MTRELNSYKFYSNSKLGHINSDNWNDIILKSDKVISCLFDDDEDIVFTTQEVYMLCHIIEALIDETENTIEEITSDARYDLENIQDSLDRIKGNILSTS